MSKHTPGPWFAMGKSINLERDGLAMLTRLARCDSYREIPLAEAEANARLIAAAPNLLEALRPIAEEPVGDDLICHAGLVPKEKCGRCGRILAARAAIAKAEGR